MESPESSNLFASSSSPDFRESEMSSSEFDWKSDKLFEIGLGDNLLCYRVNGAKEIITHVSRNLFEVDFTAWKPSIESYVSEVNGVDLESMWENIDENFPVIFGTKNGLRFPIDGRHRLAKALKTKKETILAVVLSEEETSTIEISPSITQPNDQLSKFIHEHIIQGQEEQKPMP